MAKKLTQVQINAICEKLKREFKPSELLPKNQLDEDDMIAKNWAFVAKIIRGSDLPPALKTALVKKDHWGVPHIAEAINELPYDDISRLLKTLGAPHPKPADEEISDWDLRQKHDDMIEDLKFELTMADVDNYESIMDKFRADVKKAFAK